MPKALQNKQTTVIADTDKAFVVHCEHCLACLQWCPDVVAKDLFSQKA